MHRINTKYIIKVADYMHKRPKHRSKFLNSDEGFIPLISLEAPLWE